ncbi:NACHT, LRR and PYD domains-containing protein 3-like [Diadema antillarum]|uniref:NACHT, LRR and PYD domains-containing protein 3-like n=1 Tax=Diadema antillarum TaxID=105358 RepID=UPI003A893175
MNLIADPAGARGLLVFITLYPKKERCGWNPCWRRPIIQESFHEEEEFMLGSTLKTKDPAQQWKEELKAYFRMSRRKVKVDPLNFMKLVELDEIYTNLNIIDRSSERKTPITYEDLTSNKGNLSNRLLIQGEGGSGKSTLCAKIAWDWCQGRILQDLDMVLLIPLRDVKDTKSIGDIVRTYLSDENITKANQIDDYISANQSRVLIIFDGFDEFDEKLSDENSSEFIRVLRTKKYMSCKVIVTTRPWRTSEFMLDESLAEAYTYLNVEGFSEENLSAYITKYFQITEKDNLAKDLITFMKENDVIRSNMAPFPIYCAMLCLIWNDVSKEKRKEMQTMHTFSKIFGEMISFLKEHFASKTWGNLQNQNVVEQLKKAHRAIQDVSEIALNGLLDRNLSFPEERFRDCHDAMETCCSVGVLTTETDVIPRDRRRDANFLSLVSSTVSFPNKLFQEYIAALYIENLFANDRPQYDKVKSEFLSRRQEFRSLLYFTSALGNELGLDIIHGLIDSAPHEAYRMESDVRRCRDFCVDVAFECHTEEAARAVGKRWKEYDLSSYEAGYEHTNATFERHTEEGARAVGERRKKYELSSYSPEHTNAGVAFMVRFNQVPSLAIDRVKYGRTVSRDLAEGMCSRSVLSKVSISNSRFHTDFYNILGAEASNCQVQAAKLR